MLNHLYIHVSHRHTERTKCRTEIIRIDLTFWRRRAETLNASETASFGSFELSLLDTYRINIHASDTQEETERSHTPASTAV